MSATNRGGWLAGLVAAVVLGMGCTSILGISGDFKETGSGGSAASNGGGMPSSSSHTTSTGTASGTSSGGGGGSASTGTSSGGGSSGENGGTCTASSDCNSGHCVDGVCCESSCDGQCEACDVAPGGKCAQVPSGQPHGKRAACTGTGTCGGHCGTQTTACDYPAATVSCAPESCMNSVHILEATCDGAGNCPPGQTQSCGALLCDGKTCFTSCTTSAQCVPPSSCNGGTCLGTGPNGATCQGNGDCTSGFCVDGVCCDTGCTGQCEACNAAGTCSQVTGAPVGSRAACTGSGMCGGECMSSRLACDYSTGQCSPPSCSGSTETLAANCDGAGNCPTAATRACDPYACVGSACLSNCNNDGDCIPGDHCNAGMCSNLLPNKQACTGANQCFSMNCVDGYCCDTQCQGQCEACDVLPGTCTAVPNGGAPHGLKTACTSDHATCAGTCNGVNTAACVYPGGSCEYCFSPLRNSISQYHGTCSAGNCVGTASTCGFYGCSGGVCYTACTTNAQCGFGHTCVSGACGF